MPLSRSSPIVAILWLALTAQFFLRGSLAQNCGVDAGGALCSGNNCCSQFGFCGVGDDWCGAGCQSGPCYSSTPSPPSGSCGAGVGGVVSESQFNSIFPNHIAFYPYSAFIAAASSFSSFGTDGDCPTRTREIAAFFAHISHETSGLTKINEDNPPVDFYCDRTNYPCVGDKQYYGRGPLQLSWNYNYAQCGDAIGVDLLGNPDLVATDSTISFKSAIWFWQTAQSPKPSCHSVITGSWVPSSSDAAAGRQPGFGMTINIINGGLECGSSATFPQGAQSRINLYNSICGAFGVSTGDNVPCSGMTSYS